jgi:hypothetical protein
MPAHANIQVRNRVSTEGAWIPAYAGMMLRQLTISVWMYGGFQTHPYDNAAARDRNYFAIPSSFLALSTKL